MSVLRFVHPGGAGGDYCEGIGANLVRDFKTDPEYFLPDIVTAIISGFCLMFLCCLTWALCFCVLINVFHSFAYCTPLWSDDQTAVLCLQCSHVSMVTADISSAVWHCLLAWNRMNQWKVRRASGVHREGKDRVDDKADSGDHETLGSHLKAKERKLVKEESETQALQCMWCWQHLQGARCVLPA